MSRPQWILVRAPKRFWLLLLSLVGKSVTHHVKAPVLIILLNLEDYEEYDLLGFNAL